MKPTFDICKPGECRVTLVVKEDQKKRIAEISWWERKDKKDVVQEALDYFFKTKKNVPCKK